MKQKGLGYRDPSSHPPSSRHRRDPLTNRLVDLIEEGFDTVIRARDVGDTRLMSRKLSSFRHKIVAAP